jgi:formylglycine-generating enzyme required for sulfatase activity/serine/threonine protein kinase
MSWRTLIIQQNNPSCLVIPFSFHASFLVPTLRKPCADRKVSHPTPKEQKNLARDFRFWSLPGMLYPCKGIAQKRAKSHRLSGNIEVEERVMNEELLQQLWQTTVGDLGQQLDPSVTYRSPAWEKKREVSFGGQGPGMYRGGTSPERFFEDDIDDTFDRTVTEIPGEAEPPYRLHEIIARGGMGLIYRASQTHLEREIALKKAHPQPGIQERFLSEAVVTAHLDHPNIVPVYDLVHLENGTALAMKLIGGMSWKSLLHPQTQEEQERAQHCDFEFHLDVLLKVCDAMAYAHNKGLCHNDLKPENVMVGEFGEVFVMDWGLALDFRPSPTHPHLAPHCSSVDGEVFGTPSYIAPELAEGAGHQIGPWTDVYLLGATLYELIMGKGPHQGNSMMEILLNASISAPPPFSPNVPTYLQVLCCKAMAKHPQHRYQTISDFRDALRGYLKHRESMLITETAKQRFQQCKASMNQQIAAYDTTQSRTRVLNSLKQDRNQLYIDFADAVSGFVQAQVLWKQNIEAKQGEHNARLDFAQAALRHGDLGLAEAQLASLDNSSPEVISLLVELEGTSRERSQARRHARWQRRALWLGGAALLLGFMVVILLLNHERSLARQNASLAGQRIAALHRLADHRRLRDYKSQARHLWPALPEQSSQMKRWLDKAKTLLARTKTHQQALQMLRKQGRSFEGKWHFKTPSQQWQHDTLVRLLSALQTFKNTTYQNVQWRLHLAETIKLQSITRQKNQWMRAIKSIGDPVKSPVYRGLQLKPQLGIVPIGRDPQSGLWEFVHVASGHIPTRDKTGKLRLTPNTGIILVLLPGGTFSMGRNVPTNRTTTYHANEHPVHKVTLAPFFLAKHELTQAQWTIFSEKTPSQLRPKQRLGQHLVTNTHPVESVSWEQAQSIVARMDLILPTEAQWEYAARANTSGKWFFGNRTQQLARFANLADKSVLQAPQLGIGLFEMGWRDTYAGHAPVAAFRPNPWGLYGMIGNVSEWCLDTYAPYTQPTTPSTGERQAKQASQMRVIRGGNFRSTGAMSYLRHRIVRLANFRSDSIGLRPARPIKR